MPTDERTIRREWSVFGFLGPRASSFTLAWLATHRGRLRTLIAGGRHLSVLVIWDRQGGRRVERTDEEIAALRVVVNGPEAI
jgi:hypothetical protein